MVCAGTQYTFFHFLLASQERTRYSVIKMNDADLLAACNRRITEFQSDVAERVRLGEITDTEANELTADFQDRVMRDGPWS